MKSMLWIGSRFFQSFLSGFTIAISVRTKIFPLALINPCIILIVVVNKLLVSLSFCWCGLADTNNNNLGNTPAERQRNQKLVNNNNQDYARIDKSKGEDFCSDTNCYGKL
jgi:hypothetical protein